MCGECARVSSLCVPPPPPSQLHDSAGGLRAGAGAAAAQFNGRAGGLCRATSARVRSARWCLWGTARRCLWGTARRRVWVRPVWGVPAPGVCPASEAGTPHDVMSCDGPLTPPACPPSSRCLVCPLFPLSFKLPTWSLMAHGGGRGAGEAGTNRPRGEHYPRHHSPCNVAAGRGAGRACATAPLCKHDLGR